MQSISQVKRDISFQECTVSGQPANVPTYAENTSFSTYQTFPPPIPLPGPSNIHFPGPSNVQCHLTTIHAAMAQVPPSGNAKWKVNRQSVHRVSYPTQQMPPSSAPQMFINTYPSNYIINPAPSTSYEPCHYGAQSYFQSGPVYRPPIQAPPPLTSTRPVVTVTQYNYQPVGYSQLQQPSTSNLVFRPPPRDGRSISDNYYRKTGKINIKSDSSPHFEFTIPPEQIVNSVCDEIRQEYCSCRHQSNTSRNSEEGSSVTNYPTSRSYDFEFIDQLRVEEDGLTKYIVDGCLKAEAIAVRNQHRPCFKNIKHLCTRTRTDILKPKTTVANIHSQGIPWATKDFIFAFVRLINCWYILKGYLDDREASLGKIDQAMSSDFKDCYEKWQNCNKEMIKHLIDIFVSLDNGISVQNAEIFSSFNQAKKLLDEDDPTDYTPFPGFESNGTPRSDFDHQIKPSTSHLENCINKLKNSDLEGKNVPGILRIKNMHGDSPSLSLPKREDLSSRKEHKNRNYMKPGSYRIPRKPNQMPSVSTSRISPEQSYSPIDLSDDDSWSDKDETEEDDGKVELDKTFTLSLVDLLGRNLPSSRPKTTGRKNKGKMKKKVDNPEKDFSDHGNKKTAIKFEKIIYRTWVRNYAKYHSFDISEVSNYSKYLKDLVFLSQIMTELEKENYTEIPEIVRYLSIMIGNIQRKSEFRKMISKSEYFRLKTIGVTNLMNNQ